MLAAVFVLGAVLSACGKPNSQDSSGSSGSPSASSTPTAAVEPFVNGKFDPPVTLTTWGCYNKSSKFKDGETFEKNTALDWMKSQLGVEIKYPWTSQWENDACMTKMRLSLSTNEPLPDVVFAGTDDAGRQMIKDLIETGQFVDVTELFEKYASESYKDILRKHPEIWDVASKDGKRYGIPITVDPYGNDPVLYFREDWLKKLNMQAPTTLEELEKVLDAFTNQDPDGNGKNDTLGMVISGKDSIFGGGIANASWVYGAYGVMPGYWTKSDNGTLQYGSIQPQAKEALETLKSWFEKGYIDPEFGVKDGGKAAELVTSGKAGLIAGPYWLPISPLPNLKKNIPTASMIPVGLPSGPNGLIGRNSGNAVSGVYLVNKNAKNPEALIVVLNKMLQFSLKEKGSDVEFGFVEGFDYTMEDGKAVASTENRFDKLLLNGNAMPMIPEYNLDSLAYLATGGEPRNGFDQANAAYVDAHLPGKVLNDQLDRSEIINLFTGAPTATMSSKWEGLKKMEAEVFAKIVYGKEPVSAFDDFVSKWKSAGGDTITQEVNDWYQGLQKK